MKTWRQNPQGYSDPDLEAKRRQAIERMGEKWVLNTNAMPRLPRRSGDQEMKGGPEVMQQVQAVVQPARHLKRVA